MTFMNYELEDLVRTNHGLRKVKGLIDFKYLAKKEKRLNKRVGRSGYGIEVGMKSLFLQFYYDLSDRQLAERLSDDLGFRWFCGFELKEQTPDHTYFCRFRKALGTRGVGQMFHLMRKASEEKKLLRPIFRFVDATTIKRKETTWAERDKAIAEGEEKLNNENVDRYSSDKDARFGCKGKDKFWFGYKRHQSVDMGSGLIEKVAVTPANVPDHKALKHVCPKGAMVFADKGYACKESQKILKINKCHSGIILKNNMKGKNKDKDKWLTKVRMPYEGTFSKLSSRTRYMGLAKTQMQAFLEAFIFNVKRLIVIHAPPLFAGGL